MLTFLLFLIVSEDRCVAFLEQLLNLDLKAEHDLNPVFFVHMISTLIMRS